jgi:sec-independent protein translocase protein TatB
MGTPVPIELGSLGMADSLILMVLALVVFGPRRLPQIGRQIGKLMYEFRKASNDFKFQMEEELRLAEDADRRKKEEAQRVQIAQESVSASPAVAKAIESPYPGEGAYPELLAVKAEPAPQILPPSTGETVAATRATEPAIPQADGASAEAPESAAVPGSATVLDPMGQLEQPAPVGDDQSAAKSENASATEAVSHNG